MKDNGKHCHNALERIFRRVPGAAAQLIALVAALGVSLPAVAAGTTNDGELAVVSNAPLLGADIGWESPGGGEAITPHKDDSLAGPASEHEGSFDAALVGRLFSELPAVNTGVEQSAKERAPEDLTEGKVAQFQWPPRPTPPGPQEQPGQQEEYRPTLGAPPRPAAQFLKFQYSYGTESEIVYRRDPDLNKQVKDNELILIPQVNGIVIYRPANWLEAALETIFDWEIAAQEEGRIILPSGETRIAPKRRASLLVDQAFVTLKSSTPLIELTLGRRNYEDERHWLYDTSMDVARAQLRLGHFRIEGTFGREAWVDLDLFQTQVTDRINTAMLYVEYRGIEDTKLAVYTISRNDRAGQEGKPVHIGARALGTPSDNFNYWLEAAYLLGRDESSRRISAYGFDIGFTYQFRRLPLSPSITLSYAFGTGDRDPNDNENNEFRQTGLQSNERRFAGLADFKYYGEGLDPELSNLKIITVGIGFRPMPNITVDLVYHRYRLHKIADALRGSALTAEINQDDTQQTRDLGSGFDIVVGIRNLFGVQRLGLDLRAGWFFPGKAYRIQGGDPDNPTFRAADNGIGGVAKLWY